MNCILSVQPDHLSLAQSFAEFSRALWPCPPDAPWLLKTADGLKNLPVGSTTFERVNFVCFKTSFCVCFEENSKRACKDLAMFLLLRCVTHNKLGAHSHGTLGLVMYDVDRAVNVCRCGGEAYRICYWGSCIVHGIAKRKWQLLVSRHWPNFAVSIE